MRPSRSGSSPIAMRISRTARTMRVWSTSRSAFAGRVSSLIPLTPHEYRQPSQVRKGSHRLRGLQPTFAVHQHGVDTAGRSALDIRDGVVADVYHPLARHTGHPQRLLEYKLLGLLGADLR